MSAEEVCTELLADRDFYRNSGGGVTLSGGEPLLQPAFCAEVLRHCREAGVHTAIETAGFVPEQTLLEILPLVDLLFFDLKAADPALHRELTGVSNERILANLHVVAGADRRKVSVRIPVIPGLNDSATSAASLADVVADCGLVEVELMPYHSFGQDKYLQLGRQPPRVAGWPEGTELPDGRERRLQEFADPFRARGISCSW